MMDDPRILVALIAAAASLIISLFTALQSYLKSKRDFETDVNRIRTDYMAETVAKRLLANPDFPYRSFAILRHHLGGYDDQELRRILVRAGAIRTMSKSGQELWINLDRMIEKTDRDHAFYWKIEQDPKTPDEVELFPLARERDNMLLPYQSAKNQFDRLEMQKHRRLNIPTQLRARMRWPP